MTSHRYQLTRLSKNTKLGGIPASIASKTTCPTRCSLKGNGCYAESGPLSWSWNKVGDSGVTLDDFCERVKTLPKHSLWRWAQAGDLPGNGVEIDTAALHKLVRANKGRRGYGYTHYGPHIQANAEAICYANEGKFTLNLSAETLAEADEFVALGIAPVVVVLPINQTETLKTPAGNTVMVCPASISNTTCALCAICAEPKRKFIVGFPSHGSGKAKVQKVFFAETA